MSKLGVHRSLCVEAREVAPILCATARTETARRAVLDQLGLGQDESSAIALADYFRLTRILAAASLEETLGLARRPLVSGTTDFVLAQAALGDTLHEAMQHMADAYNSLHGGPYNRIERSSDACAFRIDDSSFPYTNADTDALTLMLECVLIYLHGALCAIVGEDLTPQLRRVASRRREPGRRDPLAFWPCPVQHGAPWYAIEYAPEAPLLPVAHVRLSESIVHNRVLSLIEKREGALSAQPMFTANVRQALREGAMSQAQAARRLGCSVATLRRKLSEEGHCFRTLRQEHLNEAAKIGLLSADRIADIADALGFSDPRAFARAFREWNGQSPKSFRNERTSKH